MTTCAALRAGGGRCKAMAMDGWEHCYAHRSDLAGERRRNAARGGKSGGRGRPQTETAALKKEIKDVIDGVLDGSIPQGQGAVALQGANALLRVHEFERRGEEHGRNITPQELSEQVRMVLELVQRHVPEPERFERFARDVDALLGEG